MVAGDVLAALDPRVRARRASRRTRRPLPGTWRGPRRSCRPEVAERDVRSAQDLDAVLVRVAHPAAAVGVALDLQVGRAGPGVRRAGRRPRRGRTCRPLPRTSRIRSVAVVPSPTQPVSSCTAPPPVGRAVVDRVEHHDAQREPVGRVVPHRPCAAPHRVRVGQRRAAARRRWRRRRRRRGRGRRWRRGAHALVEAVIVDRVERLPAASYASTPSA